jgi:isopenicillin-N epimerase
MHLNDLFLLDPGIVFLNHGSFGACPKAVFEVYQAWQRRLECQPVQFLGMEYPEHMLAARTILGKYLAVEANDLVFIPNATYGVNVIARSLALQPGDEILSSDHEYGACDRTWRFLCQKHGARYRQQPIRYPAVTAEEILEDIWRGVSERTRLIFLSHITSPTALRLPVEQICARARQAGILTLIDGAHAPGQMPLDLRLLGADFYTGNCHKWMLAPKGAGFLHARREVQGMVEPLVVSWGWNRDELPESLELSGRSELSGRLTSRFVEEQEWRGTDDPSACLAVPAAIDFMQQHDWDRVRQECHNLLSQALAEVNHLTSLPSAYSNNPSLYYQMGVAEIPRQNDLEAFQKRLYEEHRVEVPCIEWNGRHFLRISVQVYNDRGDIDALLDALKKQLAFRQSG